VAALKTKDNLEQKSHFLLLFLYKNLHILDSGFKLNMVFVFWNDVKEMF